MIHHPPTSNVDIERLLDLAIDISNSISFVIIKVIVTEQRLGAPTEDIPKYFCLRFSGQLVHQLRCEYRAGDEAIHKQYNFTYSTISVQIELTTPQAKLSAIFRLWNIIITQINLPNES